MVRDGKSSLTVIIKICDSASPSLLDMRGNAPSRSRLRRSPLRPCLIPSPLGGVLELHYSLDGYPIVLVRESRF